MLSLGPIGLWMVEFHFCIHRAVVSKLASCGPCLDLWNHTLAKSMCFLFREMWRILYRGTCEQTRNLCVSTKNSTRFEVLAHRAGVASRSDKSSIIGHSFCASYLTLSLRIRIRVYIYAQSVWFSQIASCTLFYSKSQVLFSQKQTEDSFHLRTLLVNA